jgi:dTDP-4-amino-4,6-dideoxygalactose transaminase
MMNIFRDIPPTAGLPVHARELVAAYRDRRGADRLARDFQDALGVPFTAITCSGTTALYIICESLKELSGRRTILAPAYICPLVAFAIRRAGFFIEPYDIGPADFNGDAGQVDSACRANPDIVALLVNHMGGIPCDLSRYKNIVRERRLFVIEDCAQSFGALHNNRPVGTRGNFSFFSLAAGKGLTMYEGGVLACTRETFARTVQEKLALVKKDAGLEARRIAELLGYTACYRPLLFWFVFTLPYLYWSRRGNDINALREDFSIDFPVHAVSGFRKAAAHQAFPRIPETIESQRAKAAYYIERLGGLPGITLVQEADGDCATYPYMIVLFDSPELKSQALKVFSGSGLGVSQIYARALPDYGYLRGIVPNKNSANARRMAARAITLSTSPFIKKRDLDKVVRSLGGLLQK